MMFCVLSNDFMMSSKHHPFYKLLMDNLAKWNSYYGSNYPVSASLIMHFLWDFSFFSFCDFVQTVMFSTGPAFVDVQLMSYLKMQRARGDEMPENEKVHIMSQDLYGGRMYSFFRHHPGSSWHHEDASFIKSLV
jgi:mannosyltransferase OCH1-like enzyme